MILIKSGGTEANSPQQALQTHACYIRSKPQVPSSSASLKNSTLD